MLNINTVYLGDCLEVMKEIPDNSIDLTVTSPPYDNLRKYNGYTFNFEGIAKELYRITKKGGVVVWVVGDQTIKGSKTGTQGLANAKDRGVIPPLLFEEFLKQITN